METLGYVALTFGNDTKQKLNNFLHTVYSKSDFYRSPVIPSINGDVTYDLHMTIFYGFNNTGEFEDIRQYIDKIELPDIEVGGIKFLSGYQNLYKILVLSVLDVSNELENLHKELKNRFSFSKKVQHSEFLPHITLAYLEKGAVESNIREAFNKVFLNRLKPKEMGLFI
jgi:2'-5' RNA ligase